MIKVIDVLAKIAEDASLVNSEELATFIADAGISTEQQQAFFAKDSQKLAKTITNFSISMCSIVTTPQQEDQDNQEENKNEEAKSKLKFVANI
jgi:hypothetical protein